MGSLSGNLSPEQYAAIGKVANEWSFVEALLRHSIALVSEIDMELSAKMTASLMSTQLYDLYLAILHDGKDGPQSALYQHISAARRRFDELRDKRNKVVHLDWTLDWLDDAVAIRTRARGKWSSTEERFSTAEMETLAVEIKGLADALWQHVLDWKSGWLQPPVKTDR
jgi:hypothetical protein